ncbi:hypothetical protein [Methylocapsa sp. S129]|nr:hypothetical protein [Methylocapsa sp. S129]
MIALAQACVGRELAGGKLRPSLSGIVGRLVDAAIRPPIRAKRVAEE